MCILMALGRLQGVIVQGHAASQASTDLQGLDVAIQQELVEEDVLCEHSIHKLQSFYELRFWDRRKWILHLNLPLRQTKL